MRGPPAASDDQATTVAARARQRIHPHETEAPLHSLHEVRALSSLEPEALTAVTRYASGTEPVVPALARSAPLSGRALRPVGAARFVRFDVPEASSEMAAEPDASPPATVPGPDAAEDRTSSPAFRREGVTVQRLHMPAAPADGLREAPQQPAVANEAPAADDATAPTAEHSNESQPASALRSTPASETQTPAGTAEREVEAGRVPSPASPPEGGDSSNDPSSSRGDAERSASSSEA